MLTKCEHHFHLCCILEWMERSETCPVCDKVYKTSLIVCPRSEYTTKVNNYNLIYLTTLNCDAGNID